MKVLVACEFSGMVRDAFIAEGHDAISCDLLETEVRGPHIQGDVLSILDAGWDLMIGHPPCTYLANSGARWLYGGRGKTDDLPRFRKMLEGAKFFKALLNAPINKIAIENPIMHQYALQIIGRNYDQIVQPYQFGHGETKATCFWLKGLPPLQPTKLVLGRYQRTALTPPSENRQKQRSRTLIRIAEAMATQWGTH